MDPLATTSLDTTGRCEEGTRGRRREYHGDDGGSHAALAASGELEEHGEAEENENPEETGRQNTQSSHQNPPDDATTTATPSLPSGHVTDFVVTHPSQTRFTCPDAGCRLTYPTHHSLVRHVGISHKRLALKLSFKCALCDYTHTSLRSTSLHFRHAHGVAVPPLPIDGSSEKACPYCHLTFPSKHSCATHIRDKHMEAASAQRARVAAEKIVRQGESTARMKWSEAEASKFKEALAKFGPDSNIKIAAAIGTRTAAQVNVFKWRFLRANPSWLQQNYHPAPTTANAPSARCSSASPRLTPEDRSPPDSRTTQRPPAANTRSSRSSSATSESHTPPGPSNTRRQRTTGTRALPAPPAPTRQRRGPPPTSSTLPAAPPPSLAVQQLAPGSPTPTASPQAAVSAVMQYYSPGERVAQHNQEEGTPSPPSAPLTEETVSRLRRLDEQLQALRATAPDTPDPDAPGSTPPQAELLSPGREEGTQSPMPSSRPATHEEGTPSPPPAPLLEETVLRLQHADEVLKKLRASAVARWEPEPTDIPSLAQKSQEERIPLPPAADTQGEGTIRPREEALAILELDNIHLWDPEEEILSPTLLAGIATPPSTSPASDVDNQLQLPPATITPLVTTEGQEQPPPSIFRSLLHVPAFVPSVPQPLRRTEQPDQALRSSRGGEPSDTSPPPTPPTLPVTSLPLTAVSARRHQALGMDVVTRQPLTVPPIYCGACPTYTTIITTRAAPTSSSVPWLTGTDYH